jgi:hypothetical protein
MQEFKDGKHEPSVISTQTMESLSMDEKQTWRTIRKELEDIGISVAAFDTNKGFILEWFRNAVSTGAFEEQASEDDSSSITHEDDSRYSFEDPDASLSQYGSLDGHPLYPGNANSPDSNQDGMQRSLTNTPPDRHIPAPRLNSLQSPESTPTNVPRRIVPLDTAPRVMANPLPRKSPNKPLRRQRPPRIASLVSWVFRYEKALHTAVWNDDEVTFWKLLFDKGVDVDCKESGLTPLSSAAYKGHEAIVRILLENGANIESKRRDGRTPLTVAVCWGHEAVVRLLLENDADVNSMDLFKRTPVFWAAERGLEKITKLLLRNGANLNCPDFSDMTPLVKTWGHKDVVNLLESEVYVRSTRVNQ